MNAEVYAYEVEPTGEVRVVVVFNSVDNVEYPSQGPDDQELFTVEVCDVVFVCESCCALKIDCFLLLCLVFWNFLVSLLALWCLHLGKVNLRLFKFIQICLFINARGLM